MENKDIYISKLHGAKIKDSELTERVTKLENAKSGIDEDKVNELISVETKRAEVKEEEIELNLKNKVDKESEKGQTILFNTSEGSDDDSAVFKVECSKHKPFEGNTLIEMGKDTEMDINGTHTLILNNNSYFYTRSGYAGAPSISPVIGPSLSLSSHEPGSSFSRWAFENAVDNSKYACIGRNGFYFSTSSNGQLPEYDDLVQYSYAREVGSYFLLNDNYDYSYISSTRKLGLFSAEDIELHAKSLTFKPENHYIEATFSESINRRSESDTYRGFYLGGNNGTGIVYGLYFDPKEGNISSLNADYISSPIIEKYNVFDLKGLSFIHYENKTSDNSNTFKLPELDTWGRTETIALVSDINKLKESLPSEKYIHRMIYNLELENGGSINFELIGNNSTLLSDISKTEQFEIFKELLNENGEDGKIRNLSGLLYGQYVPFALYVSNNDIILKCWTVGSADQKDFTLGKDYFEDFVIKLN